MKPWSTLKWTPFFRPGVKVVKEACSIQKGAEKNEKESHETQSSFQGESCLGRSARARNGGGAIPPAQGSREPDLQVEAAALENVERAFESEEIREGDASVREAELLQKIGELTVERDYLSRGLGRLR